MAKKSAKSKGYRKTRQQKPFLSKNEIKATCIALGVILVIGVLFMLFYDSGFITASQIQDGDIVARASSSDKKRYLKLAEVNEMDGCTMNISSTAAGMATYSFTPEDENSALNNFFVSTSNEEAEGLAKTVITKTGEMLSNNESARYYDIVETQVQGYDAYLLCYSYDYYYNDGSLSDEEAALMPSNNYLQNLTLYVHYDDTHTLALHIYLTGEDESFYLEKSEILDYVLPLTECFTMVEKK